VGFDWITLTTDYGRADGFVAACHGVIARLAPSVRIIDVTHEVPPQDVRRGAVVLAQTVTFLPPAVHVAVVDPGVGTPRRGVAIEITEGMLVGPDNGLLLWAADALGGPRTAVSLDYSRYRLATSARTFDGRDVFAPAAAHLALGVPLTELGEAIDLPSLVRLQAPRRTVRFGTIATEVLSIDHFGNVQLGARGVDLMTANLAEEVELLLGDSDRRVRLGATFADVALGELVLYVDSAGYLAVSLNGGNAARLLNAKPGEPVTLMT
jgi:S-adenosyl-L-methionine hydrolase (adenosine-forming)